MNALKNFSPINNQRGNAYIFVLVAVLMMTMLAGVALVVTARARQVSSYYIEFAGLYDLAVAGNEQALFSLQAALAHAMATDADIAQAVALAAAAASRGWQVSALGWDFQAITLVTAASDTLFRVETRIYRAAYPESTHEWPVPTRVQADIVLDGGLLAMVHSRHVTN